MSDLDFYVELIRRRYEDTVETDPHALWELGQDSLLDFPELGQEARDQVVRETISQYLADLQ